MAASSSRPACCRGRHDPEGYGDGADGTLTQFEWTEEQEQLYQEIEVFEKFSRADEDFEQHPLTICFRFLEGMGKSGEYVWRSAKEFGQPAGAPRLPERGDHLAARQGQGDDLARPAGRFPHLRRERAPPEEEGHAVAGGDQLRRRDEFRQVHGGRADRRPSASPRPRSRSTRRRTRSTCCRCLKDPHELFDLDPSSEILIVFQSINKNLAEDVDYRRFRDMMMQSPYFNKVYPFNLAGRATCASRATRGQARRRPRHGGHRPERHRRHHRRGELHGRRREFKADAWTARTYDQATQNYNSIARRRESRFMQMGTLPGMLCLVSSRNYPGQFTDQQGSEARTNPRIYVYDRRLWELRPERFCGEMFNVFIGDETRKPRIIEDDEKVAEDDDRW